MNTEATAASAQELRARMVEKVRGDGFATNPRVERVLRQMPRHEFVPEADLQTAYHPFEAVITHRFADGTSLSCASAPFVVAMMLDQLDVHPGHRVLEIGAGTGYNAALLAELTGDSQLVTTIDADPEVTEQARRNLDAAGYGHMHVVTGDGTHGVPENGPYDRIIATVSPWDIPPSWWQQLAPAGRMVLPLRWRGQTRAVALAERGGKLVSDGVELCGFVPLTGDTEGERTAPITNDGTVSLHWDRDQPIDPSKLRGVLDTPHTSRWSGHMMVANEPFDGIWLRLTAEDSRTCRINAHPNVPRELVAPLAPMRSPALADGESLAYVTQHRHRTEEGSRWELGAIGHGPNAAALADRLVEVIGHWAHAREQRPTIIACPAEAASTEHDHGTTIEKRHSRVAVTYAPEPDQPAENHRRF
ncbi:methyltransferase, FxLD system [Actinopolyspora halophila]|uniref:methyltransferase, FxLD system n=1 Tax=Actinopolyspora halophila TaxID=1850 RepID=UPI000370FA2C|nr:methyltransferase, FxLD system [Actinopolyspora halophila]